MLKIAFVCALFFSVGMVCRVEAEDTLYIRETRVPVLIERQDNVLFYLRLEANNSRRLDEVRFKLGEEVSLTDIQAVKLYYGGTEALQDQNKGRFAPVEYISAYTPGKTLVANPSYSVLKNKVVRPGCEVVLEGRQDLFPGLNFFGLAYK